VRSPVPARGRRSPDGLSRDDRESSYIQCLGGLRARTPLPPERRRGHEMEIQWGRIRAPTKGLKPKLLHSAEVPALVEAGDRSRTGDLQLGNTWRVSDQPRLAPRNGHVICSASVSNGLNRWSTSQSMTQTACESHFATLPGPPAFSDPASTASRSVGVPRTLPMPLA